MRTLTFAVSPATLIMVRKGVEVVGAVATITIAETATTIGVAVMVATTTIIVVVVMVAEMVAVMETTRIGQITATTT